MFIRVVRGQILPCLLRVLRAVVVKSRSEIEIEDEIEIDSRAPLLPLREALFLVFFVSFVPPW